MCWQVAQSHDRDVITLADVKEAFFHLQIDELGLDEIDRQYLCILAESDQIALNVISAKLGLPSKTIQNVIEPYLLKESLISKDRHSLRILTEKGRKHVQSISSARKKESI
jgi:Holliday junction DNA helicase RuvB